jgi:hypothetical protein
VVYTIPLQPTDSRWVEFIHAISKWLAATYSNAVPIYTSGHGRPDPRVPGSYWLQVSVLYPLPPVPAPIRRIAERKGLVQQTSESPNGTPAEVDPALVTGGSAAS